MKVKLGELATSSNFSWQFYRPRERTNYVSIVCSLFHIQEGSRFLYLDLGMIRRNSKSHQTEGHRQRLEHVDLGILNPGHDSVRRVETRGAGADYGHPERLAISAGCRRVKAAGDDGSGHSSTTLRSALACVTKPGLRDKRHNNYLRIVE